MTKSVTSTAKSATSEADDLRLLELLPSGAYPEAAWEPVCAWADVTNKRRDLEGSQKKACGGRVLMWDNIA